MITIAIWQLVGLLFGAALLGAAVCKLVTRGGR
jgi:hypothetical protein